MSALSDVRRRRTALMLTANVVVLAAVGGLLYAGAKALARYEGAKNTTVATIPIPVTPVGMVATVDALNHLTSVVVFVEKPNGQRGGSAVVVPISADSNGLDGQHTPLTEAYDNGGADGLAQAVESTLSLTIDQHLVLTPDRFIALLAPLAPFKVTFPTKVATTDNNSTVTLYPRGTMSLSAKQMTIAMNARITGQKDAARLPAVQAIWSAVAAAVGAGRGAPTAALPTTMEDIIAQVFSGSVLSRGLPIMALADAGSTTKDVDQIDRAEAIMVFATIAPSNMSAVTTGLNFRIEAPPGHDDRVKFVVGALLYLGNNVQWVYTSGPVHADTVMFLNDPSLDGRVSAPGQIFGNVTTSDPTYRIQGVDVIVQIGTTYLSDATAATLPATTTTSTLP